MSLNKFVCAYSATCFDEYHYVIEHPIKLECNHLICQSCFKKYQPLNEGGFVGRRCGCKSSGFYSLLENKSDMNSVCNYFDEIKEDIETQFNKVLTDIKEKKDIFCAKIDYLKEEIDIKVESIKIELDKEAEKLKQELEMIRNDVLIIDSDKEKMNINDYNKTNTDETESQQVFTSNLIKIQGNIFNLKNTICQLIAELDYYELNECVKTVEPFFEPKKRVIKREATPQFVRGSIGDFCLMDNKIYIITRNSIEIYDHNFDECRYFTFVNYIPPGGEPINIGGLKQVISDGKDNIYVSCDKIVFKINTEFEIVNVKHGIASAIHYFNNHIYIIMSGYLLKTTIDLSQTVDIYKILNGQHFCFIQNTLCVTNGCNVHFYNIEPFEFKFYYNIEAKLIINCSNIENNFMISFEQITDNMPNIHLFNNEGKPISYKIDEKELCSLFFIQKKVDHNKKVLMNISDPCIAPSQH